MSIEQHHTLAIERTQGWDVEEVVTWYASEVHPMVETTVTLDSGLGATIQEQRGYGDWINVSHTIVVSTNDAASYPYCVNILDEYVVASFDEALRLLRWWDNRAMAQQDKAEREIMASEEAEMRAEALRGRLEDEEGWKALTDAERFAFGL